MPPLDSSTDDTNEGLGQDQVENQAEGEVGDAGTGEAESTTADKGAKGPASSLDVVRAVSAQSSRQSPSQETRSGDQGQQKGDGADAKGEGDEEADLPDPTDEELNQLHSKTRRRMKQLLRQKHEFTERIAELTPLAERAQQIDQFVRRAGLSSDEVNQGFDIMRLLKSEPEKAYEQLLPIMVSLQESLGIALPKDLHEQVAGGYITKEAAQEIARLRGVTARTQTQLTERTQQGQREAHARFVDGAATAVTSWENDWSSKDPDYKLKQPQVQQAIELALLKATKSGQRLDQKAILGICNSARDEVNKTFTRLRPQQRTQIKPVTGGGTSATALPAPKSSLEAARRAVGM